MIFSVLFPFSQFASVATFPSALLVSDFRSVQVGCSRFSRRCHLISVLGFTREVWTRSCRSHLNSAVELGRSVQNSFLPDFAMPLCSSLSDYCAAVRTPLHLPTTDAKVRPTCAPPPPPHVSWRSFLLAPRASAPSAANHYLLQKAPKCSALPAQVAFVDTRHLLY